MKLAIALVFVLIGVINANIFSRKCECKAVSDTVHFRFHEWDLTSCKFCGCDDASMTSCQSSCRSMVENYAKGGCGKVVSGSKVKYLWKASTCSKGISDEVFTCA